MPRAAVGLVFRRYAVAWLHLAAFCVVEISYELLPALFRWQLLRRQWQTKACVLTGHVSAT
jgi:hypothetical protein